MTRTSCILLIWLVIALAATGCTIHHSRQAMWTPEQGTPPADATFVSEEDSGLMLFSVFQLAEPDHSAVIMERARRRYNCRRMHHPQLDFFTDYWIIVAFPISRVTFVCEREPKPAAPTEPTGEK